MAKGIVKKVLLAQKNIHEQIRRSTDQSNKFSAGLAYEGYSGGYLAALSDVLLALNGVQPNRNGWWEVTHLTPTALDPLSAD